MRGLSDYTAAFANCESVASLFRDGQMEKCLFDRSLKRIYSRF